MIKEQDVIKVYMPFPDISSDLALFKHYYICHENINSNKIFFKCQTSKSNMRKGGSKRFNEKFYTIRPSSFVPFRHSTVVDKEHVLKLSNTIIPLTCLSPEKPSTIPNSIYGFLVREISTKHLFEINKDIFIELNPDCK